MNRSIAVVMLHGACNMFCKFCINDHQLQSFSKEEYVELVDDLAEEGFKNIVIGGGEPFTWRHGLRFAATAAKARGFYVQVGTNGILMPSDNSFAGVVDRFVLPLDSADGEEHDCLRTDIPGTGSHHRLILERLEELRQWDYSVTVSTVVSQLTFRNLLSLGDLLADYVGKGGRLHAWHLYRFIPRGRGGAQMLELLNISREDYNSAARTVLAQQYTFIVYRRPDMRHSRTVDFFWKEADRLRIGSKEWSRQHETLPLSAKK